MGKKQKLRLLGNILFFQAGAILVAFSLERFLVPKRIIGGGVVGIGIIVSHLSALPLGVIVLAFNLPFLGLRLIGGKFLLHVLYAVASFSILVSVFRTDIVSDRSMEISNIKNVRKGDI